MLLHGYDSSSHELERLSQGLGMPPHKFRMFPHVLMQLSLVSGTLPLVSMPLSLVSVLLSLVLGTLPHKFETLSLELEPFSHKFETLSHELAPLPHKFETLSLELETLSLELAPLPHEFETLSHELGLLSHVLMLLLHELTAPSFLEFKALSDACHIESLYAKHPIKLLPLLNQSISIILEDVVCLVRNQIVFCLMIE